MAKIIIPKIEEPQDRGNMTEKEWGYTWFIAIILCWILGDLLGKVIHHG